MMNLSVFKKCLIVLRIQEINEGRLGYYEKVYGQKVETFINRHTNAFESFKGDPEAVKIDNLKAAIPEVRCLHWLVRW